MSGYVDCACRDCFNIAIGEAGRALCHACEEAGCEKDCECERSDAYMDESELQDDTTCEDPTLPMSRAQVAQAMVEIEERMHRPTLPRLFAAVGEKK